jgi:hypothetical protein
MARMATFEGKALPAGPALAEALRGEARAWLVRAAVSDAAFADAVLAAADGLLAGDAPAVALHLYRALAARTRLAHVAAAFTADPPRFVGVPDALAPGRTLAQTALAFVADVAPRAHPARELLRRAMAVPELRREAWQALADDGEGPLPHLADLIREHPQLAGPVATRYALVHTPLCEAAARAAAALPDEPKRAFGAALQKHLMRIHAVRRWVECRRILFGR